MATLQTLLRPLLPQLLGSLAQAFASTPVVGCLTTLRDTIERYGRQPDDELVAVLSQVMTTVISSVCTWLTTTSDPEAQPELLTAFWEMCHRCLVFQPGLLLSLPCAPQLFEAAIACVCHQEFQHTRAVLTFICLFMCPTESANEYRETSAHCLQSSGAKLLRECLSGLASSSPDNLVDHQVGLTLHPPLPAPHPHRSPSPCTSHPHPSPSLTLHPHHSPFSPHPSPSHPGGSLTLAFTQAPPSPQPDPHLVGRQVELMRVLIEACPTAVGVWLKQILSSPEGLATGSVEPQSKAMQTFAALVLQQPALPQTEFQCVASDFSRICRGKLGPESLDRYVQKTGSGG